MTVQVCDSCKVTTGFIHSLFARWVPSGSPFVERSRMRPEFSVSSSNESDLHKDSHSFQCPSRFSTCSARDLGNCKMHLLQARMSMNGRSSFLATDWDEDRERKKAIRIRFYGLETAGTDVLVIFPTIFSCISVA